MFESTEKYSSFGAQWAQHTDKRRNLNLAQNHLTCRFTLSGLLIQCTSADTQLVLAGI